jgi:predicted nucleotidyltransferase
MDAMTFCDEALGRWAREAGARLLVLFGSAVNGEPGPMGDIDLAVEFAELPSPRRRLEVIGELQALVDPRMADVVFLHRDLDPVLRFEIFRGTRVLFQAEPELILEERVRAFREYQDALPFRRLLRSRLSQMAKEGTLVP